ncbi:MAG: hypothetical protein ACK57E_01865 [Erythrobacteraceae bacterium]|jgi:hypothetical protein
MAADYGARSALSSTAVSASAILQCSIFFQASFLQVPAKNTADALQSLELFARFSHLHISLVHCTRISNSN